MTPFKNISIKRKLSIIIMLTSGIMLLIACTAFFAYEMLSLQNSMKRELVTLASIIGNSSKVTLACQDKIAGGELLETLRGDKNIVAAYMYGMDGRLFASYIRTDAADKSVEPPIKPKSDGSRFENGYATATHSVKLNDRKIGTVYLVSDVNQIEAYANEYLKILGAVLMISLLIGFILSTNVRKVISRPILQLVETANAVSRKKITR